MTLDDFERRIQGLPKVLKYPLLAQAVIILAPQDPGGGTKQTGGQSPPEAESFLAFGHPTKAAKCAY